MVINGSIMVNPITTSTMAAKASSLKPRLSLQLPSFGLLLMLRQALLDLQKTTFREGNKEIN